MKIEKMKIEKMKIEKMKIEKMKIEKMKIEKWNCKSYRDTQFYNSASRQHQYRVLWPSFMHVLYVVSVPCLLKVNGKWHFSPSTVSIGLSEACNFSDHSSPIFRGRRWIPERSYPVGIIPQFVSILSIHASVRSHEKVTEQPSDDFSSRMGSSADVVAQRIFMTESYFLVLSPAQSAPSR